MFSWHQLASRALALAAARLPGPISQGSGFFNGLGLKCRANHGKIDFGLWTHFGSSEYLRNFENL